MKKLKFHSNGSYPISCKNDELVIGSYMAIVDVGDGDNAMVFEYEVPDSS
jgi:hypothetical protein